MTIESNPHPAHSAAISPEWTGQLASNLRTEHVLSPEANTRIKLSLMQKIAQSSLVKSVHRDTGWVKLAKNMQVKVLHDDGVSLSWLLRLLPGSGLPVHDHADGAEECMVLEGSLRINGEEFVAGDYQIALPGSVHHEVSSEQGSLVYLRSPSSRRKDLMGA